MLPFDVLHSQLKASPCKDICLFSLTALAWHMNMSPKIQFVTHIFYSKFEFQVDNVRVIFFQLDKTHKRQLCS